MSIQAQINRLERQMQDVNIKWKILQDNDIALAEALEKNGHNLAPLIALLDILKEKAGISDGNIRERLERLRGSQRKSVGTTESEAKEDETEEHHDNTNQSDNQSDAVQSKQTISG